MRRPSSKRMEVLSDVVRSKAKARFGWLKEEKFFSVGITQRTATGGSGKIFRCESSSRARMPVTKY